MTNTDLIIIGGGAAGLMAAATAAECGMRTVVVERKNQPGRKLLMCGNNRCNLTTDLPAEELLTLYGDHNGSFLRQAIEAFDARALQDWLAERGLKTKVLSNCRVYPKTERANDVVNFFKDTLRNESIPIILNCSVTAVEPVTGVWRVVSDRLELRARCVLVCTGGVSYPKTGSVGDGQRFARDLGHKIMPFRPGLAAFDLAESWWTKAAEAAFKETSVTVRSNGRELAQTHGGIEVRAGCAHGPAMIDASNIVSRHNLQTYDFVVDLAPDRSEGDLAAEMENADNVKGILGRYLPKSLIAAFLQAHSLMMPRELAALLKACSLPAMKPRPLKEAMVTIGGVATEEIDPATMESRQHPGLFFAGEVIDVEGPCGGFNLQAAFSTARLAVSTVAQRVPLPLKRKTSGKKRQQKRRNRRRRRR